MGAPYVPKDRPDEYRCFLIDWPATKTTTQYVTGFQVVPGERRMVHHVVAFLAGPGRIPFFEQLDAADPAPGYPCFGGPGGRVDGDIGSWVPGSHGMNFPDGTGIPVVPGSKVILQVHYNTAAVEPSADQTALQLSLADKVDREAYNIFWTDPAWQAGAMEIEAGAPDVAYSFSADPTFLADLFFPGSPIVRDRPFDVYAAGVHMHTRGESGRLEIARPDGSKSCLLSVTNWDFHWGGDYFLTEARRFFPGDKLTLSCHFNNSVAHQPLVDGVQAPPRTLNWGDGFDAEMCLGHLFVTSVP
jgi:hypothetical protein